MWRSYYLSMGSVIGTTARLEDTHIITWTLPGHEGSVFILFMGIDGIAVRERDVCTVFLDVCNLGQVESCVLCEVSAYET